MPSFKVENYMINFNISNIRVVNHQNRIFQCDLRYEEFELVDSQDELWNFLNDSLSRKDVSFETEKNKLIMKINVNLGFKSKVINYEIPEVREELDYRDEQISESLKLIKSFEEKMEELVKRLERVEKKNMGCVILPSCPYVISENIKELELIGTHASPVYQYSHNITIIKNSVNPLISVSNFKTRHLFDHPDLSNIKFLEELVKLEISHNNMTNDFSSIGECMNLIELTLYDCANLSNLDFCKNLKKLKYINVENSNKKTEINCNALCELPSLEVFTITGSGVRNTEKLTNPKLRIIK